MKNNGNISYTYYYYSCIRMIERIHLTILREIERKGSLTSAAKALNLTQSALSHTIKKLELQAGTPLWKKEGRKLKFTQAGDFVLKEAKRLLPQFERLDSVVAQYSNGEKGSLRIGMECHPCYQWILPVVRDFLQQCPGVDVDIKQKFQFGGMAALFNYEIDLLVSPDPLLRSDIIFTPVFDYEQVLVVATKNTLARQRSVTPKELSKQTLYTYPVEIGRLDIYTLFFLPANCMPAHHKTIETTEIMLELVAANRGVAALPLWLAQQFESQLPITTVRLGREGIRKQINLGTRENEGQDSLANTLLHIAKAYSHTKAS